MKMFRTQPETEKKLPDPKYFIPVFLFFAFCFYGIVCSLCFGGDEGILTASWYSVDSCRKEGKSGIMANGVKLDDNKYTAASWDYEFGTYLEVTNLRNQKMVRVKITDRGPARKLYRRGRVLDLSKLAFAAVSDPKEGVIPIKIKEIPNDKRK